MRRRSRPEWDGGAGSRRAALHPRRCRLAGARARASAAAGFDPSWRRALLEGRGSEIVGARMDRAPRLADLARESRGGARSELGMVFDFEVIQHHATPSPNSGRVSEALFDSKRNGTVPFRLATYAMRQRRSRGAPVHENVSFCLGIDSIQSERFDHHGSRLPFRDMKPERNGNVPFHALPEAIMALDNALLSAHRPISGT